MLTFTPLKKSHEQTLKDWFSNDELGMKFLPTYAKPEDYTKLIDFKKRHFWIVSQENTAIGFFDLEIESTDKCYIAFYIAPQFRKKGLGEQLLKQALQLTEIQNTKIIEAGVEVENESSIALLKKFDFIYSYTDEDAMLMYQKNCTSAFPNN